jgi:ribonucleoside-diphosphate reductase alpha chain
MTTIIKRNGVETSLNLDKLRKVAEFACEGYEGYSAARLIKEVEMQLKDGMTTRQIQRTLVQTAIELTSISEPDWQFVASRLLAYDAYKEAAINRAYNHFGYGDFFDLIVELTNKGLYGAYMLQSYTKEEIDELGRYIKPERDYLLNYSGLKLLLDRYVIRGADKEIYELPQEMFMGVSMHLASVEKTTEDKMKWAKKYYDLSSTLRFTFATPTMSGARKVHHQLSSCFIDTVPDSRKGIYASLDNFAEVSKNGGGMGKYWGKVRGRGSSVRGIKNASKGVVPGIKLDDDTSTYIDQLGTRNASVTEWIDMSHIDLLEFLKMKTNSGDDRLKAHNIFQGICVPDLFWKMAGDDMEQTWYLFCPYEIDQEMGFRLEDSYDEEWKEKYRQCIENKRLRRIEVKIKDIVKLVITSLLETGGPFIFNRDTVNRLNPCNNSGMIYSTNLCTEIAQNMSETKFVPKKVTLPDGLEIDTHDIEYSDFVVCNLSSTVISRNLTDRELEEVVTAQMRAMDASIDLNDYPLALAKVTNKKYRAVGLGSMGYHHALALQGIKWESEEHLEWANRWFEKWSFFAIKASMELAKERGKCPASEGSDWETGAYFEKRGLRSYTGGLIWDWLRKECAKYGVRNSYMMAPAPNGSSSIYGNTSACNDPVQDKYWLEEKKGMTIPQTAPDLSPQTFWFYTEAHKVDQMYSIRAAAVRQRYIDQSQSFNLYVDPENITMREIFNLYYEAWRLGMKTVYYVRSKSLEIEECVSCSA